MDINFTLSDESLRNLRNAVIGSTDPKLPGFDPNAIAFNYTALGDEIDYTALGDAISYSSLAEQFDVNDIAGSVCTRDVANELDMEDLASYLDVREIARHVDTSDIVRDVAGELDLSDVARELSSELDYTTLAYEIDKSEISESRDHYVLAKFIIEHFQKNEEFRKSVIDAIFERVISKMQPKATV